jgi:hypothetical protein
MFDPCRRWREDRECERKGEEEATEKEEESANEEPSQIKMPVSSGAKW